MRRALTALVIVAAVTLAGCAGADDTPTSETSGSTTTDSGAAEDASGGESPGEESSPEDTDAGSVIEVEIEGDKIEPNGLRMKVQAGQSITFHITSDRAARLHVHSSPEQVLEVGKGESERTLVIDRPGLVDVEEHESGLVLLQLEVR